MNHKDRSPTIKQIAQLAGVTPTTVSNVLNNSGRVSEKTRKKVQEIARQLGYKPDIIAQGLVKQRLNFIGMVVPSFHDDFSHEVFLGIENYCKKLGYKVLVGLSNDQETEEKRLIEEFIHMKVAGLIILPSPKFWNDHPLYRKLKENNLVPYVFYTRYPRDGAYRRVVCDDLTGGRIAVRHLVEKGHRNIGFYTSRLLIDANDSLQKRQGYRLAMEESGLTVRPGFEVSSDMFSDIDALVDWIREYRITALFVSTDYTAISLMHKLQKAGVKIPDDLAIVGYDNIRMSNMTNPELTTIHVPKKELGEEAAKVVIDHNKKNVSDELEIVLKPKLIVRGSS